MQQADKTAGTSYYPLNGPPLTLQETAEAVGIGLSTLQKRRELLNIAPIRGGVGRTKYIRPEDVALLQYVERHPYLAAQLAEDKGALDRIRQEAMEAIRAQQEHE